MKTSMCWAGASLKRKGDLDPEDRMGRWGLRLGPIAFKGTHTWYKFGEIFMGRRE